jgi:hypothetical protein
VADGEVIDDVSPAFESQRYTFHMATLPTPDPTPRFLNAEELLALRGTPEFEVEFRRQMLAIAESDRKVKPENQFPVDWEALDRVWQ